MAAAKMAVSSPKLSRWFKNTCQIGSKCRAPGLTNHLHRVHSLSQGGESFANLAGLSERRASAA